MEKDQEFLQFILEGILPDAESFKVQRTTDERGIFFEVEVEGEEMGKLIGKQGKNITAIRTLLSVFGAKSGQRISLKIKEREV